MAKDVITRFRLENNGFDSKIKQAAKNLSDLGKSATAAGKDFQKITEGSVEAARAFGSIQTSSNNAKDRLKELTGAFNEVAKAYNSLTKEQQKSDWAKAMADSLTQLQQRIKDTKTELQGLGNEGGIFSKMGDKLGGAMSVFAGNLMTKATMEVANLGSEMAEMVKQGVEMAKAGEGIRIAFERLGRGDILQGLREATHGTVSDLELMKAAVKFNDFKLPVEELGTMLAFAQQKAKDTGQSVDYMVDSIVTGLGRKSLMILDNLGLSANEIKEKMKETGDMTKAVGEIIREQMSKAGDYVETAADRAAQANVNLQNKMEELGRLFQPLSEASTSFWTSMKISILDIVSGPLARMINSLTDAGRLMNQMNSMAGGDKQTETDKQLRFLRNTSPGNRQARYEKQVGIYNNQEAQAWRKYNQARTEEQEFRKEVQKRGVRESDLDKYNEFARRQKEAKLEAQAWQQFRINYQKGAQGILNPPKDNTNPTTTTTTSKTTTTKGSTPADEVAKAEKEYADTISNAQQKLVESVIKSDEYDKAVLDGQKKLGEAYLKAYNATGDKKYLNAFGETADHIKEMQGVVDSNIEAQKESEKAARELANAQKKLTDAQNELADAQASGDLKKIYAAEKKVETAQVQVDARTGSSTGGDAIAVPITISNLDALKQHLTEEMATTPVGDSLLQNMQEAFSDASAIGAIFSTAVKNGIDTATFDTSGIMQKLLNSEDIGDDTIQAYVDQLNNLLKEKFDETEWPEVLIKFNADTNEVVNAARRQEKEAQKTQKAWGLAAQSVNNLGTALNNIEDPGVKAAGTVIKAIADIALGFAQASVQAGSLGPWGWLAWVAAGTAAMATTISTVHSLTGFSEGGEVKGNTYSGDQIPVAVNAGEVILTRAQQGSLAEQLEDREEGGSSALPYVTGEMIYLGLNNYLKGAGYGEIVTSKR